MESNLIFLLLAAAALTGFFAAKGAQRFKSPQVVGYVIIGLIIGPTFLHVFNSREVNMFSPLSIFALAIMGFMIGSELRYTELKKLGKSIGFIVVMEALGAFILVTLGVTFFTGKAYEGLLLGAIAAATAPAGTVDVLQEYRARGPMTTTLYAVVGLDDAMSLMIFGFALPISTMLAAPDSQGFSFYNAAVIPFVKIVASLGLGGALGAFMVVVRRLIRSPAESLITVLGVILLVCGIAEKLDLSLILANMALGATLLNWKPNFGRRLKDVLDTFTPPIFAVFFVLVGAGLTIDWKLLVGIGPLALIYLVLRSGGKITGVFVGGTLGGAVDYVRKYTGFGLFPQAGVAIGLAILVGEKLTPLGSAEATLAHDVVSIVTLTTFVVQIIGPPLLRYAVLKTGEGQPREGQA